MNHVVIFGAPFNTSGLSFALGLYSQITSTVNRLSFRCPTLTAGSPLQPVDSLIHEVTLEDGSIICDGVTYQPTAGVTTQNPISSFKLGWGGTTYDTANARFYYCKIYTNNVLVFDGIPVRVGQAGYLWDSISQTLKGNAGASGTSVTYGPDKS